MRWTSEHRNLGLFTLGAIAVVTACSAARQTSERATHGQERLAERALRGMNVDPAFGSGPGGTAYASAEQLACVGITRVRFVLKVVPDVTGSTLDEALAFYDAVLAEYRGLDVDLVLNGETVSGDPGPSLSPGYIQSFADAAGTIAARYQGRVHAYEIWNEEDDPATQVNPDAYLSLYAAAHDRIRAADSGAAIVVGGLDSSDPGGYLQQMGGPLPGDAVVALHPYVHWPASDSGGNPGWPTYEDLVSAVRGVTNAPIWFTEWGDDENGRNARLVAAFFADTSLGGSTGESYYFSWHDAQKPGHSFGVVETTSNGDEFKTNMVNAFRAAAGLTGPHPACGGTNADAGTDGSSRGHDAGGECDVP